MTAAAGKDAPNNFIPGKGRIERLFGAFQDRLITELRLAGVTDLPGANTFLPDFLARYNARFAQPAAQPVPAFRPWPADRDLDTVFCFKYQRIVANNNTVTLGPHHLQLLPGPQGRSYAQALVEVHERLDGTIAVFSHGHRLGLRPLTTSSAPHIPRPGPPPRETAWPRVSASDQAAQAQGVGQITAQGALEARRRSPMEAHACGKSEITPRRREDKLTGQIGGQNH